MQNQWVESIIFVKLEMRFFGLGEDNEVSPTWSNIAYGTINGDIITLTWVDEPKGSIMQSGKLIVKIELETKMSLESQTGEYFGTNLWTREKP